MGMHAEGDLKGLVKNRVKFIKWQIKCHKRRLRESKVCEGRVSSLDSRHSAILISVAKRTSGLP